MTAPTTKHSPLSFLRHLDIEEVILLALLGLLPFHLVLKSLLPYPLGTYWKEGLLALLALAWAWRCLRARRLLLPRGRLNLPVLLLTGLLLLRTLTDGDLRVSAWGFYMSAMYLSLYWITAAILERRGPGLRRYLWILIAVGGAVSLGGILEFILDVTLWPSPEVFQRQGFYEMYIYATHIRRVYFTFDSPTTLANYLALLLPLSLALFPATRSRWGRALLVLAALLITVCLVFTFSRGIWVAVVLVLLAVGVGRAIWRSPRYLLYVAIAVIVVVAIWAGVALWMGRRVVDTYQHVVELNRVEFNAITVEAVAVDFLAGTPAEGEVISQTWDLAELPGAADRRTVLFEHPPQQGQARIIYRVTIPPQGALRFGIALAPEVWLPDKGDGVTFQVYVQEEGASEGQFVFVRYVNPKSNIPDRKWRNFVVDLSPYAGQTILLSLITEAGPQGNYSFDWAGWSTPQLVTVPGVFFANAQKENAIVAYTSSVVNWATEETNRDRLQAWQRSWIAFRSAPWWGLGIGRTGAASLRTLPAQGFVTESQILKAAVELGVPGLILFLYLWFEIFRTAFRAYHRSTEPFEQALLLGLTAGLLAIFINGLVYQNLEVKQVNAYFWFFVGTIAFLGGKEPAAVTAVPEEDESEQP